MLVRGSTRVAIIKLSVDLFENKTHFHGKFSRRVQTNLQVLSVIAIQVCFTRGGHWSSCKTTIYKETFSIQKDYVARIEAFRSMYKESTSFR